MLWLQLLTLSVLGFIAWEDLRARSIHWWWLPLLAIGLALPAWFQVPNDIYVYNAGYNLLFLVLQLGGTFGLLMLRHRSWRNPLDRYIGLGDILFFCALAFGFAPFNFVVFMLTGLLLCLPAYAVLVRSHPTTPRSVPTAGFMAIYLICWCALDISGLVPGLLTDSYAKALWWP